MLRETKILRWADLKPILGLSRMTVYRMEKAGTFPKRIQINSGSVGWLEHEVEAWLAERMASRVEDSSAPARPDDAYDESMDGGGNMGYAGPEIFGPGRRLDSTETAPDPAPALAAAQEAEARRAAQEEQRRKDVADKRAAFLARLSP